jgi:hypothetical protein
LDDYRDTYDQMDGFLSEAASEELDKYSTLDQLSIEYIPQVVSYDVSILGSGVPSEPRERWGSVPSGN